MKRRKFKKPIVYVSKCLGFDSCRYNGQMIFSEFVDMLQEHVHIALVCPEVEIGLGVPRHPIRLVKDKDGRMKLLQYSTEADVTPAMSSFIKEFFAHIGDIDGFVLKSRSPSCGMADVKIYPSLGKVSSIGSGKGFFGGAALEHLPHVPLEDEGGLTNYRIREHFLTRIYASADFRSVKKRGRMRDIVEFHGQYKYLLMAYSQKQLRILGRIVANHERKTAGEVFAEYEEHFHEAMARMPRYTAYINALTHVMGHFSRVIPGRERQFILDSIEMYREERVPLSVPLNLLRSHAIRIEDEYLMNQVFFEPFPPELVLITDSGKGRKSR